MRIDLSLDLKLRINQNEISSKHFTNKLVNLMQELTKLVTKNNSKIQEPKTYNKAINYLIHENK